MPIDFPISPTLNETYTFGASTWQWNGDAWDSITTTFGPAGVQGTQGLQGTTGTQGLTGTQGVQGIQGLLGLSPDLTGPITSVGAATAVASQTGTGSKFVMDTSPTLIAPILGEASATNISVTGATVPANGIYLPAANTMSMASNTTERLRVDADGSIKLFAQILEAATVAAMAADTTVTYDVMTNKNVLYYTSAATANWTFNIRGNASVTLNTLMDTGQSLTVVFLNTNTGTAYYPTALQIDGGSVTPKWQGGTAPSAGNINSIDAYSYTIIKTASAVYTGLASQTKFA